MGGKVRNTLHFKVLEAKDEKNMLTVMEAKEPSIALHKIVLYDNTSFPSFPKYFYKIGTKKHYKHSSRA